MDWSNPAVITAAAVSALVALGIGVMLGRAGKGALLRQVAESAELRVRADELSKKLREASRGQKRGRDDQGSIKSLMVALPGVVQQLNQKDVDDKRIQELIVSLAESIFQPDRVMFYRATRTVDQAGNQRSVLVAAEHRGIAEIPANLRQIAFGEGKIGWVAKQKLDRTRDDWAELQRREGDTVTDNAGAPDFDVLGPLIDHTDGDKVLGVLCIGTSQYRHQKPKLMFQMVTNIGTMAMVNHQKTSQLRQQANHDGLTGLLNKRFFMSEMAQIVVNHEKEGRQPLSLFIFDIDHFKTYNDTNGHPAGDELLRSMSKLLRETMRPGDLCCRYGGEEFCIVMPQTPGDTAYEVSEAIRAKIEAEVFPFQENQPNGNLTISGGVASFPTHGEDSQELIQHADEALYAGKKSGRNRVTLYRAEFEKHDDVDLCAPVTDENWASR